MPRPGDRVKKIEARLAVLMVALMVGAAPAWAQAPAPAPPAQPVEAEKAEGKKEEKAKTFWEENTLFAYIENSYVWNLGNTSRGRVNDLRYYDFDAGYTFNIAEFSIKKDPSDRYPFGYGLVLTAGIDSQKNHALGIFRGDDDQFAFRNTPAFDLQEAYGSYKLPLGSGLTLKAGKFVTLLGYEVIEAPNNLNFSRGHLFTFSTPLTHVGALATYAPLDWLSLTAGTVVGWDVARDNNSAMSFTGQIALTPVKDFALNLNWITGPEQNAQDTNLRTVLDFVAIYTGIKKLTLAANIDIGWEYDEPSLVATRSSNTTATWQAYAAYVAYDWTEALRTALRGEIFRDADGARTRAAGAGTPVTLYDITATVQYKIWKGLMSRLEYRHDQASRKVFALTGAGTVPTSRSQDTITIALDYLFF
jgi:Putative beta-barrel porin-2, OmpL-like. bbp2